MDRSVDMTAAARGGDTLSQPASQWAAQRTGLRQHPHLRLDVEACACMYEILMSTYEKIMQFLNVKSYDYYKHSTLKRHVIVKVGSQKTVVKN